LSVDESRLGSYRAPIARLNLAHRGQVSGDFVRANATS
jgi:hypothetical protein